MMKQRQTNKYNKRIDKKNKDYGDSSGDEETELFVRNKSPRREIPTVEKNVEENDTLQSLAIRNHCTIEEIKRLNNIHKENEIHARRTIKVPLRPFLEALSQIATVHASGSSSPHSEPSTSKLIDIDSLELKLEQTLSNVSEVNEIIFNSSISHNRDMESVDDSLLNGEENVNLLPQTPSLPKPDPIISRLSCNGSDWDISYPALIVFFVLVIFAIPLIIIFFVVERAEINHNHTHLNGT